MKFVCSELGKGATSGTGKYLVRAANVWWRCAQYFVIASCGWMPRYNISMYMAHVCFYVCFSDCVGVCGNVGCVASDFKMVLKYVVCLCSGCDGCCVFCLYCEAWSCRCSCMGSVSVSSCRCCMFVSCVHPVAVLYAAFCMTSSLLMLVEDARGDNIVEAPNDTAYKRCSCHSGFKLLCKLCRTSPPPAMGARFTVFWACRPCGPAGWLALLLTKAGDVETNPGPTTLNKKVWICDICHKQIHVRKQISIRCNRIEHWVHLRCAGIR